MKYLAYFLYGIIIFNVLLPDNLKAQDSTNYKKLDVDTNRIYPYYMVDSQPEFPGGGDSLKSFIRTNYSLLRSNIDYEGFLYLCIVIGLDGKIESVNIPEGNEPLFMNKGLKMIAYKMPTWSPGRIKGIKVKTLMCLPFVIYASN
jgi:hypothetical protein